MQQLEAEGTFTRLPSKSDSSVQLSASARCWQAAEQSMQQTLFDFSDQYWLGLLLQVSRQERDPRRAVPVFAASAQH